MIFSIIWAPHIECYYEEKDEDGQRIKCICNICKTEWKYNCLTGNIEGHFNNFAFVHMDCLEE